ncbi:hypothetical protein FAI41_01460 [Acetobacteraceae bacterium]|nr:hypothetical protein FAI41_01460 [Acetobacteraceae bacterium]
MPQNAYTHNLWKRATLWRWSVIFGFFFLCLSLIFPSALIRKAFPFLNAHYPQHPLPENPQPQQAPPQQASPTFFHMDAPDPARFVFGSLQFAGRNFPLPKGNWHPILTASNNDLSFLSLLREKEGKVTGFLTIIATQHPIPSFFIPRLEEANAKCHDDRVAASWHAPTYRNIIANCAFLEPISPLNDPSLASDPFLGNSLNRATTALAFEFPTMMFSREWLRVQRVPGKGRSFENVDFWEIPENFTSVLPGSGEWNRFFNKLSLELPLWAKTLNEAFEVDMIPKIPLMAGQK